MICGNCCTRLRPEVREVPGLFPAKGADVQADHNRAISLVANLSAPENDLDEFKNEMESK
jgi:hypothetical protein